MITAPWVAHPEKVTKTQDELTFRKPEISNSNQVNALIESCPPLDTNSAYCNFLQASHFSDTCVLAEKDGEIAGFVFRLSQAIKSP